MQEEVNAVALIVILCAAVTILAGLASGQFKKPKK